MNPVEFIRTDRTDFDIAEDISKEFLKQFNP